MLKSTLYLKNNNGIEIISRISSHAIFNNILQFEEDCGRNYEVTHVTKYIDLIKEGIDEVGIINENSKKTIWRKNI